MRMWRSDSSGSMRGTIHHNGTLVHAGDSTHSMTVYPEQGLHPATVSLRHVDGTGRTHIHHVHLYRDTIRHDAIGEPTTLVPDPLPYDATHKLRELVENHHKQHDSWPAILDEILSHPTVGPLMHDAVMSHVHARTA